MKTFYKKTREDLEELKTILGNCETIEVLINSDCIVRTKENKNYYAKTVIIDGKKICIY